jgi:hypothetical protein
MGSLDANGCWQYDGADHMVPVPAFMNLGMGSVSQALEDLRDDMEAAFTLPDTGWVTLEGINSTITPQTGGNTPQIRGWGNMVFMRGRFTDTSSASGGRDICQLPAPFPSWISTIIDLGSWSITNDFRRLLVSTGGLLSGQGFSSTSDETISISGKGWMKP